MSNLYSYMYTLVHKYTTCTCYLIFNLQSLRISRFITLAKGTKPKLPFQKHPYILAVSKSIAFTNES